ncbi:hypothetical protein OTU49_017488 [Cherax quadricarinatus]|uniref:Uncharacterized protein n=1 Tax=Cherax quadricarinatus TaxID=27406 RepID=A0AAW0W6E8_CHEQU
MPSSDDRFARQNRYGPPPEFPLASSWPGIVHHLSGRNMSALGTCSSLPAATHTLARTSQQVPGLRPFPSCTTYIHAGWRIFHAIAFPAASTLLKPHHLVDRGKGKTRPVLTCLGAGW